MATRRTCDHCNRDITDKNPVITKLFMAPIKAGQTRNTHSDYSAHMDIGQCCTLWLRQLGQWQRRKTRKENSNGKRLRPADPLAPGDNDQASAA